MVRPCVPSRITVREGQRGRPRAQPCSRPTRWAGAAHPASLVARSLDPSPNLTTLTPVFLLSSHMLPVSDPSWDSQAEGNFSRSTNRLGGAVLRGGSSAQGRGTPDDGPILRHKGVQKQPEPLKSRPYRPTDPQFPPLHWQDCHSPTLPFPPASLLELYVN